MAGQENPNVFYGLQSEIHQNYIREARVENVIFDNGVNAARDILQRQAHLRRQPPKMERRERRQLFNEWRVKQGVDYVNNVFLGTDLAQMTRFQVRMTRKFVSLEIRGCDNESITRYVEDGFRTIRERNRRPVFSELITVATLVNICAYFSMADVPGSP